MVMLIVIDHNRLVMHRLIIEAPRQLHIEQREVACRLVFLAILIALFVIGRLFGRQIFVIGTLVERVLLEPLIACQCQQHQCQQVI